MMPRDCPNYFSAASWKTPMSRKFSLLRGAFIGKSTWNSHVFIAKPIIGDGHQRVAKGAAVEVTTGRRRSDHRDAIIVVRLVPVKMACEYCCDLCLPKETQ